MPQINSITVNDGATTPVSHVFAIQERDKGKTVFRDSAGSTVQGCNVFSHDAILGRTRNAANRNLLSLSAPIEAVEAGATKVVKTSLMKAEINFSPNVTVEERKMQLGLFLNLLSQVDIKANIIAISPSS